MTHLGPRIPNRADDRAAETQPDESRRGAADDGNMRDSISLTMERGCRHDIARSNFPSGNLNWPEELPRDISRDNSPHRPTPSWPSFDEGFYLLTFDAGKVGFRRFPQVTLT